MELAITKVAGLVELAPRQWGSHGQGRHTITHYSSTMKFLDVLETGDASNSHLGISNLAGIWQRPLNYRRINLFATTNHYSLTAKRKASVAKSRSTALLPPTCTLKISASSWRPLVPWYLHDPNNQPFCSFNAFAFLP